MFLSQFKNHCKIFTLYRCDNGFSHIGYTPWKINDSLNNHRCIYKAMTRLLTNSIVIFSRTRHSFFISGMVDIYDLAAIGQRITTAFSHATRPVDTNCVYTRSNAAHSTLKWTVCRSDVAIIVALMAIQQRGGLTIYCTHINVAIGVTYRVRWSLMPLFLIYADRTHLGPVELLRCFLYGWRESLRKKKNQKAKGRRRLFIVCSLV